MNDIDMMYILCALLPDEIKKTLAYVLYMYYKRKKSKSILIVNMFKELNDQIKYFKSITDRNLTLRDYFSNSRIRPHEFFYDTQKNFLLDFYCLTNVNKSLTNANDKPHYFTIHYDSDYNKLLKERLQRNRLCNNSSCFVYYKKGTEDDCEFIRIERLTIDSNLNIRYSDIPEKNHIIITRFDILNYNIPCMDVINEIASPLFEFKIDELLLHSFTFSSAYHPKKIMNNRFDVIRLNVLLRTNNIQDILKALRNNNNVKNVFSSDYIFHSKIIDFRKQYLFQNFKKYKIRFKNLHLKILKLCYSSNTSDIKKELNKEFRHYFNLLETTDFLMI